MTTNTPGTTSKRITQKSYSKYVVKHDTEHDEYIKAMQTNQSSNLTEAKVNTMLCAEATQTTTETKTDVDQTVGTKANNTC